MRTGQPLHVLLGRNQHDFTAEAPLLARIFDQGADVNEVMKKFGTPLETIAAKFKFSDVELEPFYDILLARPDLDLLEQCLDGHGAREPAEVVGRTRRAGDPRGADPD